MSSNEKDPSQADGAETEKTEATPPTEVIPESPVDAAVPPVAPAASPIELAAQSAPPAAVASEEAAVTTPPVEAVDTAAAAVEAASPPTVPQAPPVPPVESTPPVSSVETPAAPVETAAPPVPPVEAAAPVPPVPPVEAAAAPAALPAAVPSAASAPQTVTTAAQTAVFAPPAGVAAPQTAAAWAAAPPRKKGLGTGAIIAIAGGGLALILVLALVIWAGVSFITRNPSSGATAAVEGYLTAISQSDAKKAKSYLDSAPSAAPLLTDDVLEQSNALAPMSDIQVSKRASVRSGFGTVSASYKLGKTTVDAKFKVSDYADNGTWTITDGLGQIYISDLKKLNMTVNGKTVKGDKVDIFPGTYEFGTSLERFTLVGETTLTLADEDDSSYQLDIEAELTDEAIEEFRSVVRSSVDACIASTTLAAGCGLDLSATLSDGTQLTEGSVKRTLSADANATIDSMEPTLSISNPNLAQGDIYIGSVDTTALCTQGGVTGTCEVIFGPILGRPSVDMSEKKLEITWE
ncbi:MAG: hypothetical protein ACRCSP_07565 [Rhodoglobus sp.]